ncbi:MAG: hypothetical protein AAGU19_04565 [Prolixibacteraceae bacterium]
MDILLDNPETDRTFQELLTRIRRLKNGETVAQMKAMGVRYRINWGASIVSLRGLAGQYDRNHLLALKLWNKQWRETMILATLFEDPALLTEEQMDYWTKSFETAEMAEQAVANLFVHSKFAFAKAFEYCCGKKHWVRYTGILLMGRLAVTDKNAIDEMFGGFFEVIYPLMKDPALSSALHRSVILLGNRNENLRNQSIRFLESVKEQNEDRPKQLADIILVDLREMDEDEVPS